MSFLYHLVPKNLVGTTLYPLNELKGKHPEIYEKEFSKYLGREQITQQNIPGLNCLWNDVLHFTAVHPSEIKKALLEAGDPSEFKRTYFQIDAMLIDPKEATVFLYLYRDKEKEENWSPYDPKALEAFSLLPQATKGYYKETIEKGERPLLYHRVPHILYKGTLDISDMPTIAV